MMPGMNQKQMKGMMKKMGIKQEEIPATEVIIKQEDKELVIPNPQVSKVNMMGQNTYQVVGEAHEREKEEGKQEVSDEDIKTVVDQTGCSEEEAKKALEEKGDLAEAVMQINNSKDSE